MAQTRIDIIPRRVSAEEQEHARRLVEILREIKELQKAERAKKAELTRRQSKQCEQRQLPGEIEITPEVIGEKLRPVHDQVRRLQREYQSLSGQTGKLRAAAAAQTDFFR